MKKKLRNAIQKKVQKSSWNEPYCSSFTKLSCSKMARMFVRGLAMLVPTVVIIIFIIIITENDSFNVLSKIKL